MSWHYAYTPIVWPTVGTILLLLFLIGFSWRRRSVPGVPPFLLYLMFGVCHLPFKILAYLATDFSTQIFWYRVETLFWLPLVAAMTCFVLEYTYPGRWLTGRNLVLLFAPPLIFDVVGLTNDFHHLAWRGFAYNGTVAPLYGPLGWLAVIYVLGLTALNGIVFAWLFLRSPQQRWPVVMMLVAIIIARGLAIFSPFPQGSWFLYFPAIVISYIAIAISLFGFHIFDPVPMARRTVIEQLQAGMLVLDPQGWVVSLNPAAERILNVSEKQAKGQPVKAFLPAYPDDPLGETGDLDIEIDHRSGQETRYYTLSISTLKDWRGLEAGRLLMLHDVTGQKKAQAQILEQQRALAMVHERERLARELHDSLGQALAATHLQASTAKLLFERGEASQLSECLNTLADTTLQAEADMREYLMGTQTVISVDHSFFAALREFLGRYTQQYNLPVELSVPPELEEQRIPQMAAIQLLRIIQEALSNVRKHARATSARLAFTVTGDLIQIAICDNGQGFEPTAMAAKLDGGFGLRSMRERAEELGGCLGVISYPGQGTQVIVKVPVTR